MPAIITIAYFVEGSTDERFLSPIIQRTFYHLVAEAAFDIDVATPIYLDKSTEECVKEYVEEVKGYSAVCIHVDGDKDSYEKAYDYKYEKLAHILTSNKSNVVPLIPIRETEAWMLADKELLFRQLQVEAKKVDFNLTNDPEKVADPKKHLKELIRAVQQTMPKKVRKVVGIEKLYTPLGNQLPIEKLQQLPSYQAFYEAAKQALIKENLLQP